MPNITVREIQALRVPRVARVAIACPALKVVRLGLPGRRGADGTNGADGRDGMAITGLWDMGGGAASLPVAAAAGDVYEVSVAGSYGGVSYSIGDLAIVRSDGSSVTRVPAAGGGVGGSDGQVQYNNAGAIAGASKASITAEGQLALADTSSTPATPASGAVLFTRRRANHSHVAMLDWTGVVNELQPSFCRHIGMMHVVANASSINAYGVRAYTDGSLTSQTIAATNYYSRQPRARLTTNTAALGFANVRTDPVYCGNNGFDIRFRFGLGAGLKSDMRGFFGLSRISNLTVNDVSALTDSVGFGFNLDQTTMQVLCNDASGTATLTDLGASFPVDMVATDVYEGRLFCPPGGTTIGWSIERLNTGDVADGTHTTNIPDVSTLLSLYVGINNKGGNTVSVDFMQCYLERGE